MPVEISHLNVPSARRETDILRDVTCAFPDGGVTLVVGATGAGKSTLLRTAAGAVVPLSGEILYDTTPLWRPGGRPRLNAELLRRIGYVAQQPEHQLFATTVEREFHYSLRPYGLDPEVAKKRIQRALAALSLDIDLLSQPPLTLSGGMRRRVALSTTLATEADWLFLDEPSAGVDGPTVRTLIAYLQQRFPGSPSDTTGDSSSGDPSAPPRPPSIGGAVVATHDLMSFLPIAKRAIVLQTGRIVFDGPPSGLYAEPNILVNAGVGLPEDIELLQALDQAGIVVEIPPHPHTPESIARHLRNQMSSAYGERGRTMSAGEQRPSLGVGVRATATPSTVEDVGALTERDLTDDTQPWMSRLDARAKWVFMLLLSVGVLVQQHWTTVAMCAAIVVGSAVASMLPLRTFTRVLKPLAWMAVASGAVSGIRFGAVAEPTWHLGQVGFAWPAASMTLLQIVKVMLVVMLGALLSGTTSTLSMKRAIEQALHGLERLHIPVGAFALGAALLLRFIPVILEEAERFSEIVRMRGKYAARSGAMRFRDLLPMLLPLLLSVLRFGESLATAMEARGYRVTLRYSGRPTHLSCADWLWMASGGCALLLMLVLRMSNLVG